LFSILLSSPPQLLAMFNHVDIVTIVNIIATINIIEAS